VHNQELHEKVVCDFKLCHVKRRAVSHKSHHNIFRNLLHHGDAKEKKSSKKAERSSDKARGNKKRVIRTVGSYVTEVRFAMTMTNRALWLCRQHWRFFAT